MSYIYKLTNRYNKKIYIGKSKKPVSQRWARHLTSVKNGSKTHIHNAIRKYGSESFNIEILEETEEASLREIYWIEYYDSFNNGYNMTGGGDGGLGNKNCVGRQYSKNTIEKMKCAAFSRIPNHTKTWIITTPTNNEIIVNNLKKFCRENFLNYVSLLSIVYGNQRQYKGYTLRRAS